jgi:hypothetical protein
MADLNSSREILFEEAATGVAGSVLNRIVSAAKMIINLYFKGSIFISSPFLPDSVLVLVDRKLMIINLLFIQLYLVEK